MAQINIFGELHNVTGEPIAAAEQVMDNTQGKMQSEINAELYEKLSPAETDAPDYAETIELREYTGQEDFFSTIEAVFTYNGKPTQNRYFWDEDENIEEEVLNGQRGYIIFKTSEDVYLCYNVRTIEDRTTYVFTKEYSGSNVWGTIRKLFDVSGMAYVKVLTGVHGEKFKADAYQVFVDAAGRHLDIRLVEYETQQYLLCKEFVPTPVRGTAKDPYMVYRNVSGYYECQGRAAADVKWIKDVFESGKTYTAGEGISIGEDNVISNIWSPRKKVKPSYDEKEDEYYIEINAETDNILVDVRDKDYALEIFAYEPCPNEVTIYFNGSKEPRRNVDGWDDFHVIGEKEVNSKYDYIMNIQDGIMTLAPIQKASPYNSNNK